MLKKFIIKDEDGKQFEVTETADEDVEEKKEDVQAVKQKDEEVLTPEEVTALKELAKHVKELIELLAVEKKKHETTSDEDCDEADINDEDEMKEEVVETKPTDSKRSAGSIEKTKTSKSLNDSNEIAIADAWSKRFNAELSKKPKF